MGNIHGMEKLLAYINKLTSDERSAFFYSVGTSEGYLRKACSKGQKLGPRLCVSIERASCGEVTRRDLIPDDWHNIWPEMAAAACVIRQSEQAA